jgi:competence protein ComGC
MYHHNSLTAEKAGKETFALVFFLIIMMTVMFMLFVLFPFITRAVITGF